MASYWIVVPRGNRELFELLSIAFRGLSGFSVIVDRRTSDGQTHAGERRGSGPELGPDDVIVAEQAQRVGQRPHDARENRRGVPERRPASGRSAAPAARVTAC